MYTTQDLQNAIKAAHLLADEHQKPVWLMEHDERVILRMTPAETDSTGRERFKPIDRIDPMDPSEKKARDMIAQRTTRQLISDFEESDRQPMTPALPYVRGWLMDELQKRDRAAFDEWLESTDPSPRYYFFPDDAQDSSYYQDWDETSDADPGL